jgi:hypothetical protein
MKYNGEAQLAAGKLDWRSQVLSTRFLNGKCLLKEGNKMY